MRPSADPWVDNASAASALSEAEAHDVLRRHADADKNIVVGMVNSEGGFDFARLFLAHWACSLSRAGVHNYVALATDAGAYARAQQLGVPAVNASALLPPGVRGATWAELLRLKPFFALCALRAGLHVLWSDLDVSFLAWPWGALAEHAESARTARGARGGAGLAVLPELAFSAESGRKANTGLFYARASGANARLLLEWHARCQRAPPSEGHDQDIFNRRFNRRVARSRGLPRLELLDGSVFVNGRGLAAAGVPGSGGGAYVPPPRAVTLHGASSAHWQRARAHRNASAPAVSCLWLWHAARGGARPHQRAATRTRPRLARLALRRARASASQRTACGARRRRCACYRRTACGSSEPTGSAPSDGLLLTTTKGSQDSSSLSS